MFNYFKVKNIPKGVDITNNDLSNEEETILNRYKEMQQAMIDKDINKLDEIVLDGTTFTHMSGKTQTKKEYFDEITDGTLNYYKSEIYSPEVTINGNKATLKANVTLTAKVYGASGSWTLPVNAIFTKIDGTWYYGNN